jgi:hypothetical protein
MLAFALLVAFFEAELKRFADKGTLGVKLSGIRRSDLCLFVRERSQI